MHRLPVPVVRGGRDVGVDVVRFMAMVVWSAARIHVVFDLSLEVAEFVPQSLISLVQSVRHSLNLSVLRTQIVQLASVKSVGKRCGAMAQ